MQGAEWMAPEVLPSACVTERADVWSFGVLVWHLCTGEAPAPNAPCDLQCAPPSPAAHTCPCACCGAADSAAGLGNPWLHETGRCSDLVIQI